MDFLVNEVLGRQGLIGVIGLTAFLFSWKYSKDIFQMIENQTFGTRDYILEKLKLLFIEIEIEKLTNILLWISLGSGALAVIACSLLGKWGLGVILGFVMAIVGFKIPKPIIDILVERRIKAYQGQMVDGLTLLANGIRAGLSVPQSLGMVVDEMPTPISQEFNLILQQNKIGVPLEECLENLVVRIPTEDNEMFVTSVNILRETGGNLAEVFDTIVSVIRERIRLQQKIDTYTAQGRFQGAVIFSMPFLLATVYTISDPDSMKPMIFTPLGLILTFTALCFNIAGGFAIMKIIKIRI